LPEAPKTYTVDDICLAFLDHAKGYYVKNTKRVYRKEDHKTAHHDKVREIALPVRCRSILERYLEKPEIASEDYVFSPEDVMRVFKRRKAAKPKNEDSTVATQPGQGESGKEAGQEVHNQFTGRRFIGLAASRC
jgi:hypothetical protein